MQSPDTYISWLPVTTVNFICWLQLEESEVEMCDEIYEVYTDLLQQSEEEDDTLCYKTYHLVRVRVIVFNATFNNISVISWRPVLLVEETGVPWENHQPAASHWQT